MNISIYIKIFLAVCFIGSLSACKKDIDSPKNNSLDQSPQEYIVILNSKLKASQEVNSADEYFAFQEKQKEEIQNDFNSSLKSTQKAIIPIRAYSKIFNGFSAMLTESQVKELQSRPEVAQVFLSTSTQMGKVESSKKGGKIDVPWNVQAVGGPVKGKGKKVFIIDSGIDSKYKKELKINTRQSTCLIEGESPKDISDGYNHGTPIASIIAGKSNKTYSGIVPGAEIVVLKVIKNSGVVHAADFVQGMDYAIMLAKPGDVIQCSSGFDGVPYDVDADIIEAAKKGVFFVHASGNDNKDAANSFPPRIIGRNIYNVAACNQSNIVSFFSNYGQSVQYIAPGEEVIAMGIGAAKGSFTGTSFAAPHISGILLSGQKLVVKQQIADPRTHQQYNFLSLD